MAVYDQQGRQFTLASGVLGNVTDKRIVLTANYRFRFPRFLTPSNTTAKPLPTLPTLAAFFIPIFQVFSKMIYFCALGLDQNNHRNKYIKSVP